MWFGGNRPNTCVEDDLGTADQALTQQKEQQGDTRVTSQRIQGKLANSAVKSPTCNSDLVVVEMWFDIKIFVTV